MIVDQWGQNYKAAQGAVTHTAARPFQPVQMKDIGELVPSRDRKTLVSYSRRLYLNEGILLGAIQQKAMYAIGRSWQAQSKSKEVEFKQQAEELLNEEWYKICDVRGGQNTFQTNLYSLSCAIDRDGEAFVLLTKTDADYPRIQQIPCHRIASPNGMRDGKLDKGTYKGKTLTDGIIYSNGAPMAYCFNDEKGDLLQYIEARNMIHIFDPSWQEQGRGLPAFTHALNDLRDSLQSHEWERYAQLMLSSIALIEHNETGLPDIEDNENILSGNACNTEKGIISENYQGGTVRYFAAKSGGKLETIKNERPGDMWESFQNRIYRKALAGINWPYSMVWHATGQGTAERADLGRAQRAVEDRQDLIEYAASRIISYVVAKFVNLGRLPVADDWYKWKFTYPKKITIDDGRVSKELIEMWKGGFLNPQDILGFLGKSPEEHLDERISYLVQQKLKVKAINESQLGIIIEPREMAMLTPNETPTQPTQETV
jgi:capsid protein